MATVLFKAYTLFIVCYFLGVFNVASTNEFPHTEENEVDSNQSKEDFIDLTIYGERIFGNPVSRSIASTKLVKTNENPEELGPYFEGDILIPERNGIVGKSYRWPSGVVPYEISGKFTPNELSIINYTINEFHKNSCVRFRPRTAADNDYISIMNGNTGCWSSIGRLGGRQVVNLQSNLCMRTYGTPIHELMHAIGFFHEQNRHERDSFVRVIQQNIKPGMEHNFAKYTPKISYGFGVTYDYASVLHYSPKSFSVNGKPTLVALLNTTAAKRMGQRSGFSSGDITKINAMYRCSKKRK